MSLYLNLMQLIVDRTILEPIVIVSIARDEHVECRPTSRSWTRKSFIFIHYSSSNTFSSLSMLRVASLSKFQTQQIVPNTISRMPFTVKQEFRAPNLLAVKPEPVDVPLFSGSNNGPFPNLQPQLQLQQYVGPTTSNDQKPLPFERKNSAKPVWKLYDTAVDIVYSPEAALEQGLAMVDVVKKSVSTLHVGSKMRQEVWLRDIKR